MFLKHIRSSLVTYLLIIFCVGLYFLQGHGFNQSEVKVLLDSGANFAPFTLADQPWRLVTSVFLHGGIIHLLVNMLALFSLGQTLEESIGRIPFLLVFLISGITGNLLSIQWNLFMISVGASGAIFGLFGFDIVQTIGQYKGNMSRSIRTLLSSAIYVLLITLIGFLLPFDNAAHIGGLIAGILLGVCYHFLPVMRKPFTFLIFVIPGFIFYFVLPDFQVIHYNQFQRLIALDESSTKQTAAFTSDDEAATGFDRIAHSYDSLGELFIDSLAEAPSTVVEDRKTLTQYSIKKARVAAYKVKLIREETYRYLDSIQLMEAHPLNLLHHPLLLTTPEDEQETIPSEKIHRVWYDSQWVETSARENAHYYRLGYKDSLNRWHGIAEDYFMDGSIQMKGEYSKGLKDGVFRYYTKDSLYSALGRYDNETRVGKWEIFHHNGQLAEERRFSDRNYLINAWDASKDQQVINGNGKLIEYYSNGIVKSQATYIDGLIEGLSFGFYPEGDLKFQEQYERGRLVMGKSFEENAVYNYDISTYIPFPVGGMTEFQKYVELELKGSKLDPGEVKLLFSVLASGKIHDIRVLTGLSPAHTRRAIDLLRNGPPWNPARHYGIEPIESEGVVTIIFP